MIKGLEEGNDQEGLEILLTVVVTIGVIVMWYGMGSYMVKKVLKALRFKVERGDFNSSRDVNKGPAPDRSLF